MKTKIQIALNGEYLHDIDPAVVLQTFEENDAQYDRNQLAYGGRHGASITRDTRKWKEVTLKFSIAERHDYEKRARILTDVIAWASAGGILTTNYRTGQQLNVVCEVLPNIGYIKAWSGDYTITFRAYDCPFWEAEEENTTTGRITSGSMAIFLDGQASAPLEFDMRNVSSSTINAITIAANGYSMAFTNLGLLSNETLICEYNGALQSLTIENTSGTRRTVRGKRTINSADDVMLTPGQNTVTIGDARNQMQVTLYARGRYL